MDSPIAIEPATDIAAYGVVVPDLPGCFSAGDSLEEAFAGGKEAAGARIGATLDAGETVPGPRPLDAVRGNTEYAGWTFGIITIRPSH